MKITSSVSQRLSTLPRIQSWGSLIFKPLSHTKIPAVGLQYKNISICKRLSISPAFYLRPRSNSPLGRAGMSVAGPASLWPVVIAVFIVDGAGGVVI